MKTLRVGASLLLIALAGNAHAQESREYQIKAAYLVNFGRYFTWPSNAFEGQKAPFVMGVIGPAPVDAVLAEFAKNKTLQDRPVDFHRYASAEDIAACHILFISKGIDEKVRDAAIKKVANRPVVIVGEESGFVGSGGTITFLLVENKVRLRISRRSSQRLGLKPSSKLMQVAEVVD